jgi:hypothetical protein
VAHPTEFALGFFFCFGRHLRFGDFLFVLFDFDGLLVLLAQFFFDLLELFAQNVLALRLFQFALRLRLNLFAQFEHFEFFADERVEFGQFVGDRIEFEQCLRVLQLHPNTHRDDVRQLARVFGVHRGDEQLFGEVRCQRNESAKEFDGVADERFFLQILFEDVGKNLEARAEVRFGGGEFFEADAFQALHDQAHGAVRRAQEAVNERDGANAIHIVGPRLFDLVVFDGDEGDHPRSAGRGFVYQFDRARLSDVEGNHRQGINHGAA